MYKNQTFIMEDAMRKKLPRTKFGQDMYEKPLAEVVTFSEKDIVTTSGEPSDPNQGEWDPQLYSTYPNY